MRLLDTHTGQFVEKDPKKTTYAILSHTWDTEKGEQTYEELKKIQELYLPSVQSRPLAGGANAPPESPDSEPQASPPKPIWDDPGLSPKIRQACAIAKEEGYDYLWIDSCCINKSSSSELSEAINSMYRWYRLADMCYAYLADVPSGDDHRAEKSHFRKSRWFTRGWTLQELIAPANVMFLSKDWVPIGSKHALCDLVERVTKINYRALLHVQPLDEFSVAQRLSWAAHRETSREEDVAYSLLGIFDIQMPTLYGEGDRAFRRLQEYIMQRIPDQSLFAWGEVYPSHPLAGPASSHLSPHPDPTDTSMILQTEPRPRESESPFAMSPDAFGQNGSHTTIRNVQLPASHRRQEYISTPYGIRTQFQMIPITPDLLSRELQCEVHLGPADGTGSRWYLAVLECERAERPGHLLGRVCYIPPSKTGVEFVHTGRIAVLSSQTSGTVWPELFPLSPETLRYSRRLAELRTVYMSHPVRTDSHLPSPATRPYVAIQLVLLTQTTDALHSQGYSVDLRHPDPDHPETHRLTLSKDQLHTVAVEFRHRLHYDRKQKATVTAKVQMMSAPRVQRDSSVTASQPADCTHRAAVWVSWRDDTPWKIELGRKTVRLSAAGAGTVAVVLGLDFAGNGFYALHVGISDALPVPASDPGSALEPAGPGGKGRGGSYRRLLASWRNRRWGPGRPGGRPEADNVADSTADARVLQGGSDRDVDVERGERSPV